MVTDRPQVKERRLVSWPRAWEAAALAYTALLLLLPAVGPTLTRSLVRWQGNPYAGVRGWEDQTWFWSIDRTTPRHLLALCLAAAAGYALAYVQNFSKC
jgi:ABC-type nitrate/sulfonate/bicarbonate transport system permease component